MKRKATTVIAALVLLGGTALWQTNRLLPSSENLVNAGTNSPAAAPAAVSLSATPAASEPKGVAPHY